MIAMKKKLKIGFVLFLCVLMMPVLCSCTTKKHKETESSEEDAAKALPDVVFPKDQFFVHLYGDAEANLPGDPDSDADQVASMRCFLRETDPEISLVRMDNAKAQAACKGVETKKLNTAMYRGFWYMELQLKFDFSCLEYGETLAVNSVTLSIGGKEETVDMTGRLLLTRRAKEEENSQETAVKKGLSVLKVESDSFDFNGDSGYRFRGRVVTDTVIEKAELCDWFELRSSGINIYEKVPDEYGHEHYEFTDLGSIEDALPFTVPAGKEFEVVWFGRPKDDGTVFSNYQTEIKLSYRTESGGAVFCQSVGAKRPSGYNDEDEAVVWMDSQVAPSKAALEKTIFLEEYVSQDVVLLDGDDYVTPIEIHFLYQDALPFIRLESINGREPTDRESLYLIDYRNLIRYKEPYRNYRIATLDITVDFSDLAPGTNREIESIGLSVNGAMVELNFKDQLHYCRLKNKSLREFAGAWEVFEGQAKIGFNLYEIEKPVTIEKIEVYGPLSRKNFQITADGTAIGDPDRILPYTLYDTDFLQVTMDIEYNGTDPNTTYTFSVVLHTRGESGEETVLKGDVRVHGFYVDPDYRQKTERFIDMALQMKNDHT